MAERLLLKPEEFAQAVGVSRSRAYELLAAGAVPSIRLGSTIRVPVDALRDWIREQVGAAQGA